MKLSGHCMAAPVLGKFRIRNRPAMENLSAADERRIAAEVRLFCQRNQPESLDE